MSHLSPPTLTQAEQTALLSTSRTHSRDHLIFSLALGTGLRLAEIVSLNVGDVYLPDGKPRMRVRLRPDVAKNGRAADVFLPDALLKKLRRFYRWKRDRAESLCPDAPLFCNQGRRRISKRRVQMVFREWQLRAGFDRLYPFHEAYGRNQCVSGQPRFVSGAEVCQARESAYYRRLLCAGSGYVE